MNRAIKAAAKAARKRTGARVRIQTRYVIEFWTRGATATSGVSGMSLPMDLRTALNHLNIL